MREIRNTTVVLFFLLFASFRLLYVTPEADVRFVSDLYSQTGSNSSSQWQNPDPHAYNAVEVKDFSQTITEAHRLLSFIILSNQIVPSNKNFNGAVFISAPSELLYLVPIYLKGHALRH